MPGTHDCENCDDSHDEINYQGKLTSLDETLIGNSVPHCVEWPDEWRSWVDEIRAAPWKVFCELSSGSSHATYGFENAGWCVAHPIDVAVKPHFNLLNLAFIAFIMTTVWEGLVALMW